MTRSIGRMCQTNFIEVSQRISVGIRLRLYCDTMARKYMKKVAHSLSASSVTSQPSTVTSQPSMLTSQLSTVTSQPSMVTSQPSTVTSQPSTVTSQPSRLTSQLSSAAEQTCEFNKYSENSLRQYISPTRGTYYLMFLLKFTRMSLTNTLKTKWKCHL